ncbi:DUF7033 domain-containing protein [Robertkochia aurantiaca]|uniref:DUF7033 domain-containing protein n=1 Tax=Robertkochia aurantiaca TaxID=2873700 RepID=UPI001CCA84C6|nr:hypothetical protein [Robertkochia sp. 3YJGBD-33]
MLLVYTYKITPRLTYIMKHVFNTMLQIEVELTTKVEDFIAHEGPKITYTKQPLQNEFFIKSHELLFEQGISDHEIGIQIWDDVPAFFATSEKSAIPFDVFAASFYLISRYEEYLPHVKDEHGRFPVKESLAFKNEFLQKPVVDIWVQKLKEALQEKFPDITFGNREFQQTMIIDIPVIYRYKKRGIIRTLGGSAVDLTGLKFRNLLRRFLTLTGFRQDPFDVFDELTSLHRNSKVPAIFFFLIGDYATYDKSISYHNKNFRAKVKEVADYSIVSLMASYQSFKDTRRLKMERKRLINFINRPVKRIRHRFNRINIPDTYRKSVEAEFNEDYTMGYSYEAGFRAGTCTPFYFYDISFEELLPIRVNPFCVQYTALYKFVNFKKALGTIEKCKAEVQKVNGHFNMVFSNEVLHFDEPNKWTDLYKKLISEEV